MSRILSAIIFSFFVLALTANAQENTAPKSTPTPTAAKKTNQRSTAPAPAEPFDKADVKTMEKKCVKLETEAGNIDLEMFPETAPETVRNFLNLSATGFFETTVFSRVVPGFVIQGGNLSTSQKITEAFAKRARRTIPDEPNQIKHEREIVSMARAEEPNTTTTHFFILLGSAPNLDGKFAAFGRVTNGMEIVEAINKMPVEGDKPVKPVRLNRTSVFDCPPRAENTKTEND